MLLRMPGKMHMHTTNLRNNKYLLKNDKNRLTIEKSCAIFMKIEHFMKARDFYFNEVYKD